MPRAPLEATPPGPVPTTPRPGPRDEARAQDRPEPPSALDLLIVAVVLTTSVSGWASLTFAQVGVRHTAWVVVSTLTAVAGGALVLWKCRPVSWSLPRADLALAAGLLALSAWMFLPGFPYGAADKDPGVYVSTAALISERGTTSIEDEVVSAEQRHGVSVARSDSGRRHNAAWVSPAADHMVHPQFYHLWPALQANVRDLAGNTGVFHLTPLLAALSVVLAGLTARRAFGLPVGVLTGVLLSLNMIQVWAAKMPGNEMFAQLLLVLALWGAITATRSRWGPSAGVAGLAVGLGFLNRPDGLLIVLLAAAVVAVLILIGSSGRLLGWFAAGAGLVLPFAAFQAWGANAEYSAANGVPSFGATMTVALVPLLAAAAVRWAGGQRTREIIARFVEASQRRRTQAIAGTALAAGLGALMLFALARPELLGEDWTLHRGSLIRTFNEDNLIRLGWFLTPVGLGLLWLGTAVLACTHWRADRWLIALPGLALLPLYVFDARIASRMMWWTRRFVPVVIVVAMVLIALALVWLWHRRGRFRWSTRAAAVLLGAVVLIGFASQSLPLRDHREMAGTPWVVDQLDSLAEGDRAVFVWDNPSGSNIFHPARLFPMPLWFDRGHVSAVLDPDADPGELGAWDEAFAGMEVFLITYNDERPAFEGLADQPVLVLSERMPVWEEPQSRRPAQPIDGGLPLELRVWRFNGP